MNGMHMHNIIDVEIERQSLTTENDKDFEAMTIKVTDNAGRVFGINLFSYDNKALEIKGDVK
jgi:hypothetical protein